MTPIQTSTSDLLSNRSISAALKLAGRARRGTRIAAACAAVLGLATLTAALVPLPALAQDATLPSTDNAKVAFLGEISADNVLVRSGPSENYYTTLKLARGTRVTVMGIRNDWLKIAPPEGSFCYVAKQYIQQTSPGNGIVSRPEVNVRAGSSLNTLKTTIQTKLPEGAKVQILGERDEYFMIKPPAGAFVFVSKQFVAPVRALAATEVPDTTPVVVAKPADTTGGGTTAGSAAGGTSVSKPPLDVAPLSTAPLAGPSAEQVAAEAAYDAAEAQLAAASSMKVEEMPLADLTAKYEALMTNPALPGTLQRDSAIKHATLAARLKQQQDLAEIARIRAEGDARLATLRSQQTEIASKLSSSYSTYTAVGTLAPSNLPEGGTGLFRLTDPASGRTVIYLRSTDPNLGTRIGQFVGIKGDVTTATAGSGDYKVVATPTGIDGLDPSQVNTTVTATYIPWSLLPRTPKTQPETVLPGAAPTTAP